MQWLRGVFFCLLSSINLSVWAYPNLVAPPTHVVLHPSPALQYAQVITKLKSFEVPFQETDFVDSNDRDHIHIFFDLDTIQESQLPQFFIACQTKDLTTSPPSFDVLQKLAKATAVWDFSLSNTNTYKHQISHYLIINEEPSTVDAAMLPLFLPTDTLSSYKDTLVYANTHPSDISWHLPVIFCHALFNKPKIIVEAGIRGGESTVPLFKAAKLTSSRLIGLDIDAHSAQVYAKYNDPLLSFFAMDDLVFCREWRFYLNKKIDVLFIDTSHEYEHTKKEIDMFFPLLADQGVVIFHDSNWSPGVSGVTRALKEYFIDFDETRYRNRTFTKNSVHWQMIQYPLCYGLFILKKNPR